MRKWLAMLLTVMMLVNSILAPVSALSEGITTDGDSSVVTTVEPTTEPAGEPAGDADEGPEAEATEEPEAEATEEPEAEAIEEPEAEATEEPETEATEEPEAEATEEPEAEATEEPEVEATEEPEAEATEEPAVETTEEPAAETPGESEAEATEEPAAETTGEPAVEATEEPVEIEALTIVLLTDKAFAFVGESAQITLNVEGGFGEKTVVYQIGDQATEPKLVSEASDTMTFTPAASGDYTITAVVTDEAGQNQAASVNVIVAEHDVVSRGQWTARAKSVQLTEDWRENVAAVALSQVGYVPSESDFILESGGKLFYSVYGDWYGQAYAADWRAMFVAFCAEHAGIPQSGFPRASAVSDLYAKLNAMGVARSAHDYKPEKGDLVFLKDGGVGIVVDANDSSIHVVEGGCAVVRSSYALSDDAIIGYASMLALMVREGTLVDPLDVALSGVAVAYVGQPVEVTLSVAGGLGDLVATSDVNVAQTMAQPSGRPVTAVSDVIGSEDWKPALALISAVVPNEAVSDDEQTVAQGENTFVFVPETAGLYTISVTVADEANQTSEAYLAVNALIAPQDAAAYIARPGDEMADTDGNIYFATLDEAVEAVQNGETICLLEGVKANIVSSDVKTYTLDLCGFAIDGDRQGSVYRIEAGVVTIKNGTLKYGQAENGAGVHVAGGSVTLQDVTITDGNATGMGGGLYVGASAGTVTLKSVTISNNKSASFGGGLYIGGGKFDTEDVKVSGNVSNAFGGGLYVNANVTLKDMNVTGNTSHCVDASAYAAGAGIFVNSANVTMSSMRITQNTNTNSANASGTTVYGAGMTLYGNTSANVSNSEISYNKAYGGETGGLYIAASGDITLTKVNFVGNEEGKSAGSAGQALTVETWYNSGAQPNGNVTLNNCNISGHTGGKCVVNFAASTPKVEINGGKISDNNGINTIYVFNALSVTMKDVTICDNTVTQYGTIYLSGSADNTVTIEGSVISGNQTTATNGSTGGIYYSGNTLTLKNTLITGNKAPKATAGATNIAGGVYVNGKTLDLTNAAVYGNMSAGLAQDISLGTTSTSKVTAASEMSYGDMDFSDYVWLGRTTSGYTLFNGEANGGTSAGRCLTAFNTRQSNVAKVGDTYFASLTDTVDAARERYSASGEPQLVTLVAGSYDPENYPDKMVLSTCITVDFPLTVDLGGCALTEIKVDGSWDNGNQFIVKDAGSLTLIGEGTIASHIKVNNNAPVTLASKTNGLYITFGDGKTVQDQPALILKDGFGFTSKFTVEPSSPTNKELSAAKNKPDDVAFVYTIADGTALSDKSNMLAPANVTLQYWGSNKKMFISLDENGELLQATNPVYAGIYISSTGDDVNGDGTSVNPYQSLTKAMDALKTERGNGSSWDTIFIVDNGTPFTVGQGDGVTTWPIPGYDFDTKIMRYVASGNQASGAPLITVPSGVDFVINDGVIIDGRSGSKSGGKFYTGAGSLIHVPSGAQLTMRGGVLENNGVSDVATTSYKDRAGGAVKLEGSMTMSGGEIRNCTALLGGGIFVTGTFEMSGGTIRNCAATGRLSDSSSIAASGGAVMLDGSKAKMTMSGQSVIRDNTATNGAGVAAGGCSIRVTGGRYETAYGPNNGTASFVMTGGTFTGNKSSNSGGGVFIQMSYAAEITGGTFTDNHAGGTYGGGAIYVNGGKVDNLKNGALHLSKALIKDNYAPGGGGGLASCPTGRADVFIVDGGIIYNNTSDKGADDILSHNSSAGFGDVKDQPDGVGEFMMDGTPYRWKSVGTTDGYVTNEFLRGLGTKYLYTSAKPKPGSEAKATVIITDNTASLYGGAIGSNGDVIIGGYVKNEIVVEKTWKNGVVDGNVEQIQIWLWEEKINRGSEEWEPVESFVSVNTLNSNKGYAGKVTFDNLDTRGVFYVLESVSLNDGTTIWAVLEGNNQDNITDALKAKMEASIVAEMQGKTWLWSNDSMESVFTSVVTGNADEGFNIENTAIEPSTGEVIVTKTVVGPRSAYENDQFYFTVTLTKDEAGQEALVRAYPYTIGTTTGLIRSGERILLKHGDTLRISELPDGTYFTITEETLESYRGAISVNGEAVDAAAGKIDASEDAMSFQFDFENTLRTSVVAEGTKTVDGEKPDESLSFSFKLMPDAHNPSGDPVPADGLIYHNNADGVIRILEGLEYTQDETYTYYLTEVDEGAAGFSYDDAEYVVKVIVKAEAEQTTAADGKTKVTKHKLVADVAVTLDRERVEAFSFNNTYEPAEATLELKATKMLLGGSLKAGDFRFQLEALNGGPLPRNTIVANDARGNIAFEAMTFTKADTYRYRLTEIVGDEFAVEYDAHVYLVTVTVTNDGSGKLNTSVSYTLADGSDMGAAVFLNTAKTLRDLTVTKTVTGMAGDTEEVFTFDIRLTVPEGANWTANAYTLNYTGYGVEDGTLTFTKQSDGSYLSGTFGMSSGQSITVHGLPEGIGYAVTEAEANQNGYETTSTGETGTIGENNAVEFVNHKEPEETPSPTPEVTETPTPEVTETPTPEVTETPTPEVTETPTPEVTETPTPRVTETPTPRVTETPTPEVTETPTPEVTETPTPEVTETPTPEVTETPTPEVTETPTPEVMETPTPEVTETPTPEVTEEPTPEVTETPTPEVTEEPTPEVTEEPTPEVTEEPTPEVTETPTATPVPQVQMTVLTGTKTWVDNNNADGMRPESIEVVLYANGVAQNNVPIWTNTEGNVWTYTFTNLPVTDAAGVPIVYTVTETPVEYYITTQDGTNFTNTIVEKEEVETISVSGQKTWQDNDNANNRRPESITIELLQNGIVIRTLTVTEDTNWQYSFTDLPEGDGYGNSYVYTIREQVVPGYYVVYDGMNVTNVLVSVTPPVITIDDLPVPRGVPNFYTYDEGDLSDMFSLFDYGVPLFGMLLGTGLEVPMYPFVFAGMGVMAIVLLVTFGRKKKED